MSLDSSIAVGGDLPEQYQEYTFATYPPEGDQAARQRCEQFAATWDGQTALGLVSPRCGGAGKTGLMVSVYKTLLPQIHQHLQEAAWLYMVSFFQQCEMQGGLDQIAEVLYSAGLLILDDLAYFPVPAIGKRELTRLLTYRVKTKRPTFFVTDTLETLHARLTPDICSLLLTRSEVIEVYGPNLFYLAGFQNNPHLPELREGAYAYREEGYDVRRYTQGALYREENEDEEDEEGTLPIKEGRARVRSYLRTDPFLAQIREQEPRIGQIIETALHLQPDADYNRVRTYAALKQQAYFLVGNEAENPQLRTSACYDVVMKAIFLALPPEGEDEETQP